MGPLGWQETIFIFVLALLIFGPRKLPELGRTIGKAITEFRRASNELKSTWDREMRSLEQESQSLKEISASYQNEIYNHDSSYNYNYDSYDGYSDYSSSSWDSSSPSTAAGASATEGAGSVPGSSDSGAAPETDTAAGVTSGAESGFREASPQPGQQAASESQAVSS
ncbi:MAG TPA: twin-arginine translocase TatA/TatE family subunit [Bryobacteraceae bacterium]|nr:twin-arginine translocase TatA/TatE family subunit [Bryobacteraceae bacterium]